MNEFEDFINNDLDTNDLETTAEERLLRNAKHTSDNFGFVDLSDLHKGDDGFDKFADDVILFQYGDTRCPYCGAPFQPETMEIWSGVHAQPCCNTCFYTYEADDEWRLSHPEYKPNKDE